MSKVLILGDIHIGKSQNLGSSSIYSNLNSRVLDQKKLLDWVLIQAEENFVTDIITTGDVFEEVNPGYELINLFFDWLNSCSLHKIKVHIILGNHDYTRINNNYYSWLDLIHNSNIKNIFVYKNPETIHFEKTSISFFPFLDRKALFTDSLQEAKDKVKSMIDYQFLSIPKKSKAIAIGHFALEGSLYIGDEIDDLTNEIILPLDYFDYDFVWMGHVHKYQELKKNIFHIGSMDISDFGEANENKYIVLFDLNSNTFETKKIPTKKLNKIKIKVSPETIDSLKENLSNIKDNIVSIDVEYIDGAKPIGKNKIKQMLLEHNPYFIANISETKEVKLKENSKTKEFKTNLKIDDALKKYADNFISNDLKDKFLKYSKELIAKAEEK